MRGGGDVSRMAVHGGRADGGWVMREMLIDSIRVSLMNYQRVVVLKEREADRFLPIWIGSPEADAIAVRLQSMQTPRPLTHDLLGSVIATLGASVQRVVVTDLANDTFYAKLVLSMPDGAELEVDCRPSDAIAMAVRCGHVATGADGEERWFASLQEAEGFIEQAGLDPQDARYEVRFKAPIFVEDAVLDRAGVQMAGEGEELPGASTPPGPRRSRPGRPQGVTQEEIERMSAFSEFLEDLPGLEDLGGGNPQGQQ